jgi:hypothetical protein
MDEAALAGLLINLEIRVEAPFWPCQRPDLRYPTFLGLVTSLFWATYLRLLIRRCPCIHRRAKGWTTAGEDIVGLGAGTFSVG